MSRIALRTALTLLVLFSAAAVLLGQLLIDLIYPMLDPRLRDVIGSEATGRG